MENLDQVHCHSWIHSLISTKDESPIIQAYFKDELNQIIEEEFLKMGSSVRIINSSSTHLNCLFNLSPAKSVQQLIDQIKKVSSSFINSKLETQEHSVWEKDFNCLSVDSTNIDEVYTFIRDQDIRNLSEPNKSEFSQLLALHKVTS